MLKIDGSIGYGQILRTAIALSALTLKPVKIFNIRIRRPNPGLRPQHLMGVKVAAEFCAANVRGAKVGSLVVEFIPKYHKIPEYKKIDIGTAGSVTLLLQTLLPLLVFSDKEVKLEIIGGTDVKGAPTTIYVQHVLSYFLKKIGIDFEISTFKHGFYPKGGGRVFCRVLPSNIKPLKLVERGELIGLNLWSVASKELKKRKVAERLLEGFKKNFELEVSTNAYFRYVDSLNPGCSLNAHLFFENCVLGEDGLGEKGKKAEDVGREVAKGLINSYNSKACLDKYVSDQILVFLALAEGKSLIKIEEFTEHVRTNLKVIEKFLEVSINQDYENKTIEIKGCGFKI